MIPAELAYQAEATTGEGSIWHPERHTLFWVDIEGQTLYEYHPDTKECSSWKFDRMVSTVVPETDSTVIIALQNEIVRVNLHDGHTTSVAVQHFVCRSFKYRFGHHRRPGGKIINSFHLQ